MAVRSFNEAKKAKKKEVKIVQILIIFLCTVIATMLFTQCVSNYVRAAGYDREADEVESLATSISAESAEISETLKEENHAAYFEKIAREEHGYCKPGEKIYYNSSYGD